MNKSYRFIFSALFLGALLLSACSGVAPRPGDDSQQNPGSGQTTEVVFTGSVQSMGGGEWTISGQTVGVDGSTSIDANIQVGDIVRVEAAVSGDGKVLALKIEASLPDDAGANANDANANDANANDANANGNVNSNDNTNAEDNSNGNLNGTDNSNSAPSGPEQEIVGAVQAMTNDSITIGGVTYKLAQFTEFKTPIVVGDQVKIHVIVNADGTLTIREIEKTSGTGLTTNGNGNSNDDNSNVNSNDDNGNDDNGGGGNSNDDNGGGSNGNDDNGGGSYNGNSSD